MKIGIISDTHGGLDQAEKAVNSMGQIDLLVHAGDTYTDAEYIKNKFNIEVIAVSGNTDGLSNNPSEKILTLEGKKIFLTHGHRYGVKYGLDKLYYRALELEADIVIYGHSHMPLYIKEGNVIVINPGSPSRPRGGSKPSYALLEINSNQIDVEIKNVE